jgi:hypothetical protein
VDDSGSRRRMYGDVPPESEHVRGTELMGGTSAEIEERDLYVEEIMAPSPVDETSRRTGRGRGDQSGFGGSQGYAAETHEYATRQATYPGGNQEVDRGHPTQGPRVEQQPQVTSTPRPRPLHEQTSRPQPVGSPRPGQPQPRMRAEQHVDRVPARKPGFLENLRESIVPVAFIGVGIGLMLNRRQPQVPSEEIHTTVRSPGGPQRDARDTGRPGPQQSSPGQWNDQGSEPSRNR